MNFLRQARPELAILITLFGVLAYFHQGGGWNQNSRFNQVRSIVEAGTLHVNDYCSYQPVVEGGRRVGTRRVPIPVPARIGPGRPLPNGLDVAVYEGRIYPNKPPGTTLLALPGYWLVHQVDRLRGGDPDDWWPLTVRFWLTTLCCAGALGAIGGVVFFRASRRLFPDLAPWAHGAATFAFALGTLMLPFSTILMDHGPHAVLLLSCFGLVHAASSDADRRRLALAGLIGGLAVMVNYTAAMAVGLIGLYALVRLRSLRPAMWMVAGAIAPLLSLALYHQLCFGSPTTIANAHQAEMFVSEDSLLLGVFGVPDPVVTLKLLFSHHRGLFVASPVLLLSLYGLWRMFRDRGQRLEAGLFLAIFVGFLAINASFNAWYAGHSFGPRYLIPAIPFLALPLAPAFARFPRVAIPTAVVSVLIVLLVTATSPQISAEVRAPLTRFSWPLAMGRTVEVEGTPYRGPVSANPAGVYEPLPNQFFPDGSLQSRWNSFNLGELVFFDSSASLLPLLLWIGAGCALVSRLLLRRGPD